MKCIYTAVIKKKNKQYWQGIIIKDIFIGLGIHPDALLIVFFFFFWY